MLTAMRRHPRAPIFSVLFVVVASVLASLAYVVTPSYLGALLHQ